jgi:hypothetical protein
VGKKDEQRKKEQTGRGDGNGLLEALCQTGSGEFSKTTVGDLREEDPKPV